MTNQCVGDNRGIYERCFIRCNWGANCLWHTSSCLCAIYRGYIVSYINTIMMGDTPVDVYGTECSAEPDVGLMTDYVDIEDLEVGGISIYEMVGNSPIFDQIQEAINDMVNS